MVVVGIFLAGTFLRHGRHKTETSPLKWFQDTLIDAMSTLLNSLQGEIETCLKEVKNELKELLVIVGTSAAQAKTATAKHCPGFWTRRSFPGSWTRCSFSGF
jgi:hypothetical protein